MTLYYRNILIFLSIIIYIFCRWFHVSSSVRLSITRPSERTGQRDRNSTWRMYLVYPRTCYERRGM